MIILIVQITYSTSTKKIANGIGIICRARNKIIWIITNSHFLASSEKYIMKQVFYHLLRQ